MKTIVSVYILLFVTITVKAGDNNKKLSDVEPTRSPITSPTTAVPTTPLTPTTPGHTTANSTTDSPTTVSPTTVSSTTPNSTSVRPDSTTPIPTPPTTTKVPSTKAPTSTLTPDKPETPTLAPNPIGPTTAIPHSTNIPSQPTTSPPTKNHFDGLSFMGGIIFASCIVGIGAFSWKFYKAWTDRSYRTL